SVTFASATPEEGPDGDIEQGSAKIVSRDAPEPDDGAPPKRAPRGLVARRAWWRAVYAGGGRRAIRTATRDVPPRTGVVPGSSGSITGSASFPAARARSTGRRAPGRA